MNQPWFLSRSVSLSIWDRLRLLFGVPLRVRFDSPDGNVHAACNITCDVGRGYL